MIFFLLTHIVSEKLDKMGGQIMKLLDGQNQTNSKLSLLTKMMEAMKNFTGPGNKSYII